MSAATTAPPIACPSWCASEDHKWGEGPDVWPMITHEVTFENDVVSIQVFVEDEMTRGRGAPGSGGQRRHRRDGLSWHSRSPTH
ncbi:MAG: hypothetical protein ACR2KO_09290 [Geodermatophilaceae bacterium]